MKKRRRKNRKKGMSFWRRAGVIFAVIVLALVVFFTVFHTENVIVSGNTRYSDEDIKSICLDGSISGNTLLFSLFNSRIDLSDMPYLDHADVKLIDCNTLHISVEERIPAGRIEFGGKICYFDKNGNVLEIKEKNDEQDLTAVLVEGVTPDAETISPGDVIFAENEELLAEISVLSRLLMEYELVPDKVLIDENNQMTPVFGDIRVELGSDVLLEEKISRLHAILPDLTGSAGTLHLEDYSDTSKDIIFESD